ncbi:MAG: DUF2851 family protein [Chloroflexota bacterium]|nr:DUF2851 family protein [Chloroflexota bacterium]
MLHVREHPRQQPVLERALAQCWRDHGASLPPLECDDGSRLRVLYPGRASASAGPDFRDAVLQREGGEVVRGDVELHLRRGGWEAHGHGGDRNYNAVVLHVVLRGGDGPVVLASGRRAPTAVLFPRTLGRCRKRETLPPPRPLPLAALPSSANRLARTLDREGDARFFEKVRAFTQELQAHPDPSEALYRGLMGGLGYGGNSPAMTRLADGLSLPALIRALRGGEPEERRSALASALLQASGLVTEEHPPGQVTPVLSRSDWKLFRVRPTNRPSRRLEGMAALLDRAWDEGLASWAVSLVREGSVAGVRAGLTIASEAGGALIGADRASDLAVNVLLPFVRAWGNRNRDTELAAAAVALYRAWPQLQENAVTEEAARVLGIAEDKGFRRSARRQQGLIRVYRRRLRGEAA